MRNRKDSGRDPGGFVALPWSVLDSNAYSSLSHPARNLLLEIARQFVRDNNGRLLTSAAYLSTRGWKSIDVITRAKRELLEAGFIFETVKGHRPNKASWYAITWRDLDYMPGYDAGARAAFQRSAYLKSGFPKITGLIPSGGANLRTIAPSDGANECAPIPPRGAVIPISGHFPTPPDGNHLDVPSKDEIQTTPKRKFK